MNQEDNQSIEMKDLATEIKDLAAPNAEEVKGGTKMPSPTTPISGPKPTSK